MLFLKLKYLNCFLTLLIASVFIRVVLAEAEIEVVSRNGKMTLTAKYCDENGENVMKYKAGNNHIEVISPNAFFKCLQVTMIYLGNNEIKEIDENTFKSQEQLIVLYLHCNQITLIPKELLAPLKNLEELFLEGNSLKTLDFLFQSNLVKLTKLDVNDIKLFEFDATQVMKKLPTLELIFFAYNFLTCGTYNKSESIFATGQVIVSDVSYVCASRIPQKCLTDQQLLINVLRKQAEADYFKDHTDAKLKESERKFKEIDQLPTNNTSMMEELHLKFVIVCSILVSFVILSCTAFVFLFLRTRNNRKQKPEVHELQDASKLSTEDYAYYETSLNSGANT